jgi:hypothetical protein
MLLTIDHGLLTVALIVYIGAIFFKIGIHSFQTPAINVAGFTLFFLLLFMQSTLTIFDKTREIKHFLKDNFVLIR